MWEFLFRSHHKQRADQKIRRSEKHLTNTVQAASVYFQLRQTDELPDKRYYHSRPPMDPIQLFDQHSLYIQDCGLKGRGVITRTLIPPRTTIDVSPILLFPLDEYTQHGQYTQLDHYTYRWKGGMALALGLGSMFNHSNNPNVGFQRDFDNKVIRYTTLREIQPNEELCISYGSNLWFPDMEQGQVKDEEAKSEFSDSDDQTGDAFLAKLQLLNDEVAEAKPLLPS
ncbi:hypothetical protein BGZ65_002434 [Modicella reniformis]|uniref:SET domain-containing protein n=1 Tax=Modicella reniformis TaxID=1440133 RepID=A0A9P6M9Q4_9FUNG|nr:hypothetical protein BGZ65_002434 [Modicella reniformis]